MREHKIGAIADMVIAMEEVRSKGQRVSTRLEFFRSSRYERAMIDGEEFAGFPKLCNRNLRVDEAMYEYARMAMKELDFDGLGFEVVKAYGASMIGLLAKYRYQKRWTAGGAFSQNRRRRYTRVYRCLRQL
jgi:alpha-amylase